MKRIHEDVEKIKTRPNSERSAGFMTVAAI